MEYIKEYNKIDIKDKEKNYQLIDSIIQTQNDLKKAHINFDYAENDLIDFYTYHIKALQSKLDYLTKIAKLKNIDFSMLFKTAI